MQKYRVISLVLCFGFAVSAMAGDVRIVCSPGLDVFVDDDFVGVSTAPEDGKYLDGLSDGYHVIKIEKDGFLPRWFGAYVGRKTYEIELDALTPTSEASTVTKETGAIEIASNLENATVKLEDHKAPMEGPAMRFSNVSVGLHDIWFERYGIVLHEKVVVQANETTVVIANFIDNRVEVPNPEPDDDEAPVPTEVAETKKKSDCYHYWIQVVQTSDAEKIKTYQEQLEEKEIPTYHQRVLTVEDDGVIPLYKLRIGPMADRATVKLMTRKVFQAGFQNSWVVREECQ